MEQPECWGKVEKVFPVEALEGEDPPRLKAECRECPYYSSCLEEAMASPAGQALKQGRIYEACEEGKMDFFPRWLALKEKSRIENSGIRVRTTAERPVSLYGKITAILLHPGPFFRSLPQEEKIGPSLSVAIISGSIGMSALVFWPGLFGLLFPPAGEMEPPGVGFRILFMLFGIGLIPLLIMMQQALLAILFHPFLRIFGAGPRSFSQTFKVLSYAQGILPWAGGIVGALWVVLTQIVGLKTIHRMSAGRVLAAFLFSVLMVLVLFMGVFSFFPGEG
jgi:hypothetical protein